MAETRDTRTVKWDWTTGGRIVEQTRTITRNHLLDAGQTVDRIARTLREGPEGELREHTHTRSSTGWLHSGPTVTHSRVFGHQGGQAVDRSTWTFDNAPQEKGRKR